MKQGIVLCIVGVFVLSLAHASVLIEQVYVNPVGSESGGEAVVIRNAREDIVFLENWTLATQTSKKDATLPAIRLWPNQTFLIADTGWNEKKDDLLWKEANYEEAITLDNAEGGIALIDTRGTIIDAVGWGDTSNIEPTLYQGMPTRIPPEGKVLFRKEYTGNNAQDFILSDPQFEHEDTLFVVVNITEEVKIIRVMLSPDEAKDEGIQVLIPLKGTKKVKVEAEVVGRPNRVYGILAGQIIEFMAKNSSTFVGEFIIDTLFQPGSHTIGVHADEAEENTVFTAHVQQKIRVDQTRVLLTSLPGKPAQASVLITNEGFASVRLHPTIIGNSSLDSFIEVSLDGENFQHPSDVQIHLNPKETRILFVRVATPTTFLSGVYKSRIRMEEI